MMMLESAVSFEETIKNPKQGVQGKGGKVQVSKVGIISSRKEDLSTR